MAVSVGELLAYLRLDSTAFDRGIASARTEMSSAAQSATRMTGATNESAAALTGAGRQANVAASGSAKLRAAQLSAVAATERYNAVLAQGNASVGRLASAEASLIRANQRVAAATPAAAAGIASTGKAAESSGGMFASAGSKGLSFLGTLSKLGLGLGAFAAAVEAVSMVKAGARFQQQMLQIQTMTGGTADEVKRMSAALAQLGPDVATGPDQLAVSLYHVESVGLRGAKALNVVKVAAQGAKVGTADLEETTNALTSSVASGIKGVQNMSQAMGALTTIVGAGDMKMSDLNESLGTGILAVAKEYGVSLTEVGAVLATFGDNNIRGADAATALRMTLMAFAKPAAEGKDALAKIGLTVEQLGKDMQKGGLTSAVDDLNAHMKAAGVTGGKVGQFITEAFGKKAGAGLAVLMGQTDRFHTKLTEIEKGSGSFGSKWDATTKTTSFAFQKLRAEAEAAGVALFEKVGPGAANAATWLGTTLPHAIGQLQATLQPLEHEVGIVFAGAWKAVEVTMSATASAMTVVGGFLRQNRTLVNATAAAVLAMWAAWKGYQLVKIAITAIGSALETMALKAMYARDAVQAASTGLSAGTMAMTGIGLAVAAATVIWQHHAAQVAANKSLISSYTQAVKEDSGAIGDHTRAQLADKLATDGVFRAGEKYGLTIEQMTQAALGNQEAINAVSRAVGGNMDAFRQVLDPILSNGAAIQHNTRDYADAQAALGGLNEAVGNAAVSAKAQGDQLAYVVDSQGNLIQTTQAASDALDATTQQMSKQKTASELLKTALDNLNGVNLSVEQTTNAMVDAQNTFTSGVTAAAKAGEAGARSIGRNTEAGLKNRENLVSWIQSMKDQAQATADSVAAQSGQTAGLHAGNAELKRHEQELLAVAVQLGLNKTDVMALITAIGQLSTVKADPKIDADTKPASRRVATFTAQAKAKITALYDINTHPAEVSLAIFAANARNKIAANLPGRASGGGAPEGFFAVGEQGPELAYKSGSNVQIFSNSQSKAMIAARGMKVPGFAGGTITQNGTGKTATWTYQGHVYQSRTAAENAQNADERREAAARANARNVVRRTDIPHFLSSLAGSADQIKHAESVLVTAVGKAGGGTALERTLAREGAALLRLAGSRALIADRLKAANEKLAEAQKLYADEKAKVADAITSSFDITSAGTSPERILAQQAKAVALAAKFKSEIDDLRSKGVSQSILTQFEEKGPGSEPALAALTQMTPAQLAQLQGNAAQLSTIGNQLGKTTADSLYGAGVAAAQGLVKGLQSQDAALVRQMKHLADAMVNQIRRSLRIHSPSMLFRELGGHVGRGFALGIADQHAVVRSAAAGMAGAAIPVMGGDGASAGRLGVGQVPQINVYPRQGQSEYEIGVVTARQLGWAVSTA